MTSSAAVSILSYLFIFFPISLLAFKFAEKYLGRRPALVVIILASAYSCYLGSLNSLLILIGSVFCNFYLGKWIHFSKSKKAKKIFLTLGITANLTTLYYFKYFIFTLSLFGVYADQTQGNFIRQWVLPVGISFWTFQQISFLLDKYNSRGDQFDLLEYASMVMFFPHLLAGPIVRTSELGPQLQAVGKRQRDTWEDLSAGMVLLVVGLAKKVIIADTIGTFPDQLYRIQQGDLQSHAGPLVAFFSVVCYTLQLYFDFSGYCDMGMGEARMFGFILPINFQSPLQATSLVDYWRKWHITLTRFFTETIYTPMAVSLTRRYDDLSPKILRSLILIGLPIVVTFFLTGVWHGAGSQFVVFGLLNGIFMAVGVMIPSKPSTRLWTLFSKLATFTLVSLVLIFFRTPNLQMGWKVLEAIFVWPQWMDLEIFRKWILEEKMAAAMALIALVIALVMPNFYQIFLKYHKPLGFKPDVKNGFRFEISLDTRLALIVSVMLLVSDLVPHIVDV